MGFSRREDPLLCIENYSIVVIKHTITKKTISFK